MSKVALKRKVARGAVIGAVLVVSAAMAFSALAAATVTIDSAAKLVAKGSGVTVTGTVTCSYATLGQLLHNFSDQDTLTVSVSEKTGQGVAHGSTTLAGPPCDGSSHAWSTSVPADNPARPFRAGNGAATAFYTACALSNGVCVETQQGSASAAVKIS